MEIRKLTDPPKAEAIRDMVRYARNVIEEFRRAKHYKYILSSVPQLQGCWRVGKREPKKDGFKILHFEGRMSPSKMCKDLVTPHDLSQPHQSFMMLILSYFSLFD